MTAPAWTPTVTAVIPTRDRPELVRLAIASVLAQDYRGAIEVVVVADQTDPDPSLASDEPNREVRVVANRRTPGLAGARNTGLEEARGDLIAFCDDDDEWYPTKLTTQVDVLRSDSNVEVVIGGVVVDRDGRHIRRVWPHPWVTVQDLSRSRVFEAHPSTYLFRRSALDTVGWVDEDLPGSYAEDRDWLLRAARVAPVAAVAEPLARVRWGATSFFSDRWATIAEAIDRMLAKHPELSASRQGLAQLYGRKAFAYAALDQRGDAWTWARQSLRLSPTDRRAWISLAVLSRAVSARRVQELANAVGRGV